MKDTKTVAPSPEKTAYEVVLAPLGDISPSRHQNRQFGEKPDKALLDLATSIEAQGVIEPIILRLAPSGDCIYELVAGERRWRASTIAGCSTIPAIVRDLSEAEAAEITVTENLQRENLSPLEEAAGVVTLLDLHGEDPAIVADRLRVPAAWVARRARLAKLSKSWVSAAADPESVVSSWAAIQLEVIARLSPEQQDETYEKMKRFLPGSPSVKTLEKIVGEALLRLEVAIWNTDDDELLADRPACSACADRTSQAELLFTDLESSGVGNGDRCTNGPCWRRKTGARMEQLIADLPSNGVRVTTKWYHHGATPDYAKGATLKYHVQKLAKKNGGVTCLIVDGPDAGKTFYGAPRSSSTGSEAPKATKTLAERREGLERRRWKLVADQIVYLLVPSQPRGKPGEGWTRPDEMQLARIPDAATLLRLAAAVGTTLEANYPSSTWSSYSYPPNYARSGTSFSTSELDKYRAKSDVGVAMPWVRFEAYAQEGDTLRRDVWRQIAPVLAGRCGYAPHVDIEVLRVNLGMTCSLIGEDLDGRYEMAVAARPEPKAWAGLNKDGTKKAAKKRKPAKRKAS